MRPKNVVVSSALIAALALVAVPGLVGSRTPSTHRTMEATAFHDATIAAPAAAPDTVQPDPAFRSAGHLDDTATLVDPALVLAPEPPAKPAVRQPATPAGSVLRPARQVLTGEATFYDHGTTAMRLPRGTRIVVCGAGGCLERVVSDYGPQKPSRIIDLYRPDFFTVCGCPSWSGVTQVTVYVY